jgi:hypothetical protein
MIDTKRLIILQGLPGSGKTEFAKGQKIDSAGRDIFVIHLDDVREKYGWGSRYGVSNCIKDGLKSYRGQGTILLDGLFLTNDDIYNAICYVDSHLVCRMDVLIHRWNEDRATCVKNDGGRREKKSTGMILNATYEEVDVEGLNKRLEGRDIAIAQVIRHDVKLKPDWVRCFKSCDVVSFDGKLRSGKWSLGGEHGSCYGGRSYSEGEEPLEFYELDDLLDDKWPDLRLRHYRKIKRACVSTEEHTEDEYYGGYTTYMNWVCDLEKMYNMLEDFGYVVRGNN